MWFLLGALENDRFASCFLIMMGFFLGGGFQR